MEVVYNLEHIGINVISGLIRFYSMTQKVTYSNLIRCLPKLF